MEIPPPDRVGNFTAGLFVIGGCFWRGFCDALSLLSIAVLKVEWILSLTRLPSLAVAVKWKFHCGPITFRLFFYITHLTPNFRR